MTEKLDSRLINGGEMGRLIREKDWTDTPLGTIEEWPDSLCNIVNTLLQTKFPVIIYWGEKLTAIYNDAYRPLLDKPEALGRPFHTIWSEVIDIIGPLADKTLAGEVCYFNNREFTLMRYGEPEQAWFDFCYSPLRDETGEVVGILNICVEKTQQIEVEQSLRKSEERYRTLFESIDEGFAIIEVLFGNNNKPDDYRFLEVNPAFEEQTGIKNAEGKRIRQIVPDHEEHWFEIYGKVALTREPVRFENSAKALDRFYDGFAFPFGEPDSRKVAVLFKDIAGRRRTEEQLRRSERELADFFDNATLALHWVGPDGTIFRANQAELDLLGYSRDEYVGRHIADFHVDQDVIDDILQRLSAAEELHDYESRMRCKDGSIKHVLISSNVLWKNGEFIHTCCFTRDVTEQKLAEEAVRASEKKYRMLFESMDEGFCIIQVEFDENDKPIDYRHLETNPSFEEQTGLKDIEGKSVRELLPDHEEHWFETYGKVALTGEPIRFESSAEALDRWYNLFAFRVGEPQERKVAVLFNDITERKRNEHSNALLSAIVNSSDDAIISKNLDGVITSWNASAERMFGYTAEEAIGQSVTMLFPPERIDEEDEILERIRRGKRISHFETIRLHKDGTPLDVSLTISPVLDSEGRIVGASKIARDITDRKQAQEERERLLREVEAEREKLIDIFQYAPSVMAILQGPNHVHEQANELYKQLIGNRNVIGKSVREVFPEFESQGFIKLLDRVYETGETYVGTDERVLLKSQRDGTMEEHYMNFVYQPIRDPDGSITGVFAQGVDLTERKRAEEELKTVNKTLEERVERRTRALKIYQDQLRSLTFQLNKTEEQERHRLAAELHDNLGQMLAVTKMKLQSLKREGLPDNTAKEIADLTALTNDALSYTRELMSDLKPPPTINKEDVREVLRWVAQKMEKYDLEVTIEDDGKPKPLSKEIQTALYQCVREFLFNVVKHANVNEARLAVSRDEGKVQITVEDEGSGFDMTKKKPAPTEEGGFGLFNIHERIDLLGGSLDIASEPGKGTKATLSVPMKDGYKFDMVIDGDGETSRSSYKSEEQAEQGEKVRILLVDDHEMMRRGLRKIIEEQPDFTIIAEASDGNEAVTLARETSPDVVVMDINMPVMDGIEATRQIATDVPGVRIIGLSLHDQEEVTRDLLSAGGSAYLIKTQAFETLCTTIRDEAQMAGE